MNHLLSITAPGPFLRTNRRDHFHQRAILTRTWREAAAWEAKRQHLPVFEGPVRVTATFHRADKRQHDLDGLAPTAKAAIDGLRDAGVLAGDDTRYIPELVLRAGEQWADAALVLTITAIEDAA